ncbi:MAG: alpha/beta hydrolase, partial [Desulfofustis sp.]
QTHSTALRSARRPSLRHRGKALQLMFFALLAPSLLLFAGCSPLTLVNSIAPDDGFDSRQGISYGRHERQKLDIYMPQDPLPGAPVIVFFYGGSWRNGEREKYRFVGQALSARGYTTVIPDYRLYPQVRFPEFVEDGAAAVAWVDKNISLAEQGIVLLGHSAGAHLAALVVLDEHYLKMVQVEQKSITGMIGLAGPYAFEPQNFRRFRDIFATAVPPEVSQPIHYARGDAPPLLLLHGADDSTVLPFHSSMLAKAIRAKNGQVEEIYLPDVGHYSIILALSEPFVHLAPEVLPAIETFLQKMR